MRLKQYLTDKEVDFNEIIESIKRDCKPAITFYRKAKAPLWRGLYNDTKFFVRKNVRTDRKPRVINKNLHNLLDKLFMKHFGWKARSEGVFTGSEDITSVWGRPYTIFPIGKFDYIWTENPESGFWDILTDFENLDLSIMVEPEKIIEEIENAVKNDYDNKGLENVLKSKKSFEAILKCKEYYGVASPDSQTFDYIMEKV